MTEASAQYSRSYNKYVSADYACEQFGRFRESLVKRRDEILAGPMPNPQEALDELAIVDTQIQGAPIIAKRLWVRRMEVYQAHRLLLAQQNGAGYATKGKDNGEAEL